MTPRTLDVQLSKIVDEGCGVRTLRLELPDKSAFSFAPGQSVEVGFPDSPSTNRPYSIGSSPLDTGFLEITLDRSPALSARLFDLKGGETLRVRGPRGDWRFEDTMRNAVLISEGTGITPLRSMIRYALAKGLPNRISLFYTERTPNCILFAGELDEWTRAGVGVHISITGPRDAWGDALWDGPTGPWTAPAMRKQVPEFKEATFMLCGRNRVVDEAAKRLLRSGIDPKRIIAEKWGEY